MNNLAQIPSSGNYLKIKVPFAFKKIQKPTLFKYLKKKEFLIYAVVFQSMLHRAEKLWIWDADLKYS